MANLLCAHNNFEREFLDTVTMGCARLYSCTPVSVIILLFSCYATITITTFITIATSVHTHTSHDLKSARSKEKCVVCVRASSFFLHTRFERLLVICIIIIIKCVCILSYRGNACRHADIRAFFRTYLVKKIHMYTQYIYTFWYWCFENIPDFTFLTLRLFFSSIIFVSKLKPRKF